MTKCARRPCRLTRQHLAAYKYPRRFEFDDTLSLASGKVLKPELVDRYRSLASE
jgi:acyl-CoA synthetase (AMP-forming)/AMP-acid ligase II